MFTVLTTSYESVSAISFRKISWNCPKFDSCFFWMNKNIAPVDSPYHLPNVTWHSTQPHVYTIHFAWCHDITFWICLPENIDGRSFPAGIFDTDSEEEEATFRHAVEQVNKERTPITLVGETFRVVPKDDFLAQQTSKKFGEMGTFFRLLFISLGTTI